MIQGVNYLCSWGGGLAFVDCGSATRGVLYAKTKQCVLIL